MIESIAEKYKSVSQRASFQRAVRLSDKTARLVLSEIAKEIDGKFYLKQEGRHA